MEPTAKELALAKKVNVKWRKWRRADEAYFRNRWDDAVEARKMRAFREFHAVLRAEVYDDENGETFTVTGDTHSFVFRYAMKGDPRLVRTYDNAEEAY